MFAGRHRVERPVAEDRRAATGSPARKRQRHAVQVARRRGLRRVVVGVGVEPEHRQLAPRLGAGAGDAADRAHRDRVVAAEEDRHARLAPPSRRRRRAAAGSSPRPRRDAGSARRAAASIATGGGLDLVERAAVARPGGRARRGRARARRCAAPAAPSACRATRRRARGRRRGSRCRGGSAAASAAASERVEHVVSMVGGRLPRPRIDRARRYRKASKLPNMHAKSRRSQTGLPNAR